MRRSACRRSSADSDLHPPRRRPRDPHRLGRANSRTRNDKIDFGSRILFEPEVGVGAQVNDRLSVEASWVHMSHAQLFGRENPGIDNFGVRLNLGL